MKKIAMLGAGTWGLALARMLANNNNEVTVWSKLEEEISSLKNTYKAPKLNNLPLPKEIIFTSQMESAIRGKDIVVIAVPSVFVRNTAREAKNYLVENQIVVCVAKGIEKDTLMTMTEIIKDELKTLNIEPVALSGPTHAEEVALDMPTTIVSASENDHNAKEIQKTFSNENFRVYTNNDVLGVEICGAVKNIIAIACGIANGIGFGDNLKAAIITRGLAEISRLGTKMGCNKLTFSGLAGMGDLIVTATSNHSRNNRAGNLIGQGYSAKEATEKVGMVVEGLNALPAAISLAKKYDVELPIVFAVDRVVNGGENTKEVLKELMLREFKAELY